MAELVNVHYLVVGAGAMGMAFVDTLLAETDLIIAIVDRLHQPSGHWTTAYPFVRLHQPSAFYGVASKRLGQDTIDQVGLNKGLYELATGDEICAYYSQVMDQHFLPSGRVTYFPKCEYTGNGEFQSIVSGKPFRVDEKTRIVDATFMRVIVPSMRPPPYQVSDGVGVVTPNDMPKMRHSYQNYTIVGAGKTGIDACLWLLAMGIEPSQITWIMPRDSWLLDRSLTQPGSLFTDTIQASVKAEGEAIMSATTFDDLLLRIEACGRLLRLDPEVRPTTFRCATVSKAELEQIRKVKNIVRKGRVLKISANKMRLEHGSQDAVPDTLYIDCSANALAKRKPIPVFDGSTITLQSVRPCQQTFSAALIAHVEAAYDDVAKKNELCCPIPHPSDAIDWLIIRLLNYRNSLRWASEPKMVTWLSKCRLDIYGIFQPVLPEDPEQREVAERVIRTKMDVVNNKLQKLLHDLPKEEGVNYLKKMTA